MIFSLPFSHFVIICNAAHNRRTQVSATYAAKRTRARALALARTLAFALVVRIVRSLDRVLPSHMRHLDNIASG
jgi:hypothetical protein